MRSDGDDIATNGGDVLEARDATGLRRLVERLSAAEVLAVDTEFLAEHSYHPRLCLLQLSDGTTHGFVDPLACSDLGPLRRLFGTVPELAVHAGDQDLGLLSRHVGVVPDRVLDTQIAAAFLGHGYSISYARLVEACLGVRLHRSHAYTDWSRRPLDPEQIAYAVDDVRHLVPVYEVLRRQLSERGRLAWVEEECTEFRRRAVQEPEPERQWRRVAKARSLQGRSLAVLRELAAWREREAARRDQPRGRLVPDRVLVEAARRPPRQMAQLRKLRGLHPREAERSGPAMLEAIARGLECPEAAWPRWPEPPRGAHDARVDAVTTLLDAFLRGRAQQLALASRIIANRDDLERLVAAWLAGAATDADEPGVAVSLPVLEGWRRDVVGEDLLRLLRGELRLGVGPSGLQVVS